MANKYHFPIRKEGKTFTNKSPGSRRVESNVEKTMKLKSSFNTRDSKLVNAGASVDRADKFLAKRRRKNAK